MLFIQNYNYTLDWFQIKFAEKLETEPNVTFYDQTFSTAVTDTEKSQNGCYSNDDLF